MESVHGREWMRPIRTRISSLKKVLEQGLSWDGSTGTVVPALATM